MKLINMKAPLYHEKEYMSFIITAGLSVTAQTAHSSTLLHPYFLYGLM